MNDGHGAPVEARLAVLENNVQRLDTRLSVVSERTHTLISSMQAVTLGMEEAHSQREVVLTKVEHIANTVNILSTDSLRSGIELGRLSAEYARRGARSEKIQLALLAAVLALVASLISGNTAFHLIH